MQNHIPNDNPRILVISNNPFSKTSNNGKTLASLFSSFPCDDIAQIYFSSEVPTVEHYNKFFRISDVEALSSFFTHKSAGRLIESLDCDIKTYKAGKLSTYQIFKSDFFRILREIVWKNSKWNSTRLSKWIDDFSPDIVFFCAGDSIFAYDIVFKILEKTGAKLVTYITDDYILPRKNKSPLWWFRRNIILNKMHQAVSTSDLFITISDQMKIIYKSIFDKDSITILNITDSMQVEKYRNKNYDSNEINLIYAGGLHFQRYKTLHLIAEAIDSFNSQSEERKAYLYIYSTTFPSDKIKNKLNIKGASKFMGSLDAESLKIKLNEADIMVHVESFDSQSIESTRLSISTKIPEYLSLQKPILAVGPLEVASMKYLKDVAYCITNKSDIKDMLTVILNDHKLRDDLSKRSYDKYKENHDSTKLGAKIRSELAEIFK